MSILDNLSDAADKGSSSSKELASKSYAYSKLKIFQITTLSISILTKIIIIGSILFIGFLFMALAGAFALGAYHQNMALGYLIIGLSIFFIGILLYLFRKFFDKKVIVKMSKIFFKELN